MLSRRPARARWRVLLAAVPLLAALTLAAPAPAAAAGLVIVAQTTYQVIPEQNRVHVTVDAVATSFEPDTDQGRIFYSGASFAVQPGAANVLASSGGAAIGASITRREEGFAVIEVTFGSGVFYQQSYAYTVSFDLVDPTGHGSGDLRIGRSLAALPVWAFGSDDAPGSSVTVDLPPGFQPSLLGDEMAIARLPDGTTRLTASASDPFAFFTYLTADRPGAYEEERIEIDVNGRLVPVVVRGWDDDQPWREHIKEVLGSGLPELQRLIGAPYSGRGPLTVEEAASSRLGAYAGVYNSITGVIRVRYDADAWVALHEAAHIWFNGSLFADRWIGEAFAEFYGVRAGKAIGADGRTFQLTDQLLRSRFPLNDWGAVGVESLEIEDYAYAATYSLAQRIAQRSGVDGLRPVWEAAVDHELAYQPVHGDGPPETRLSSTVEDWQRFLDLLEERTDEEYADLWRRWVVNAEQRPLLDDRADARELYQQTVEKAGSWDLPDDIRAAMNAWRFDDATDALAHAGEVLELREVVAEQAAELDLEPPATFQLAFEDDLERAEREAAAEQATLAAIERAVVAARREPTLLETIGTLGVPPDASLQEARDAFEAGDLTAAEQAAAQSTDAPAQSADAGRLRVAVVGGGILALDATWMGLLLAARNPRRRAAAPL
jgi:hypothetical protein